MNIGCFMFSDTDSGFITVELLPPSFSIALKSFIIAELGVIYA